MFRSLFNMTARTARSTGTSKTPGKGRSGKRKSKAWRVVQFSDGRVVQFPG